MLRASTAENHCPCQVVRGWVSSRSSTVTNSLNRDDAWAGVTAGRRVMACALIADPAGSPRTVVASPTAVAQRLADQVLLVTVLGDDAATTAAELDDICAQAR